MPSNPLDLFVDNRVISLSYTPGDRPPEFHFTIPITSNEFTAEEAEKICAMLANPRDFSIAGARCIWECMAFDWRSASNFEVGAYELAKRAFHYLESIGVLYVESTSNSAPLFCDTRPESIMPNWDDLFGHHHDELVLVWREDCVWGIVDGSGSEAYFLEEDYVCDNYRGHYYINDEVANENGVTWRDCCEQYWPDDTGDSCCSYNNEGEGESFDDSFNDIYSEKDLTFLNLTKVSGMDYTFGVELETQNSSNVYSNGINMRAVHDGSTEGLEYVSGVLQGNKGVSTIQEMCHHLQLCDAKIDRVIHFANFFLRIK